METFKTPYNWESEAAEKLLAVGCAMDVVETLTNGLCSGTGQLSKEDGLGLSDMTSEDTNNEGVLKQENNNNNNTNNNHKYMKKSFLISRETPVERGYLWDFL